MEQIRFAVTDGVTVMTSDKNPQIFPMMQYSGAYPAALLCEACMRKGIRQLWFVPAPAFTLDDTLGWDFHNREEEEKKGPSAWVHSFKRGTDHAVDLVRPSLDKDNPFRQAESDTALLAALIRFRELTGVTFHHSSSATSKDLLIGLHQGHKNSIPLRVMSMPEPARQGVEQALTWCLPAEAVRALPAYMYVHAYDKNGAYLGPASNLPVGAGRFDHVTGVTDKDMGLPGYFRIADQTTMFPNSIPVLPPVRSQDQDGTRWVTTPTLAYIRELAGCPPPMLDAYVWREHHQPLQPWYRILRDAKAQLQEHRDLEQCQLALAAIKGCYTALTGYFGAPGTKTWDRTNDVLYRPDIRDMVIAKARCTMHRTARRSQDDGAVVLGISDVDTFYILSNDPDPVAAKPARLNLGTEQVAYKVKGSWVLTPAMRELLESDRERAYDKLSQFKEGPEHVRA